MDVLGNIDDDSFSLGRDRKIRHPGKSCNRVLIVLCIKLHLDSLCIDLPSDRYYRSKVDIDTIFVKNEDSGNRYTYSSATVDMSKVTIVRHGFMILKDQGDMILQYGMWLKIVVRSKISFKEDERACRKDLTSEIGVFRYETILRSKT